MTFLPIPVDENIENLKLYENKTNYKDFFFALSHGVNFDQNCYDQINDKKMIKKLLQNRINLVA